jgi:CYTH domain-containing protein
MQQQVAGELELEVRFLAREIPKEIEDVAPVTIEDTYFPEDPSVHAQLRVRRKGDKCEITKKVPVVEGDRSAQNEFTIALDDLEYEALAKASTRKVAKDRYVVAIDGYQAEVGVFRDRLTGLVLIEFEFNSVEEKDAFQMPPCCLVDVTNEELFAGGILSSKTYVDIADKLQELGYTRLR